MANLQDITIASQLQSYGSSLPGWLITNTDAASSSVYTKLFMSLGTPIHLCDRATYVLEGALSTNAEGLVIPRQVWVAPIADAYDVYTVTLQISGQTNQTLIETTTQLELLMAPIPSYSVDYESNSIVLRGLAQIEEILSPDASGYYTFSSTGLITDEPVFIKYDNDWFQFPEYIINRDAGYLYIEDATDTITIRYSTQAQKDLVARATILINDEDAYFISPADIWNTYDEHGLITYITRADDQTNNEMATRINLAHTIVTIPKPNSNILSVSNELSSAISTTWFTSGAITISNPLGSIKNVVLPDLTQTKLIQERLTTDEEHKVFYATYREWSDRYYLYRDGIRLDEETLAIIVSGGVVTSSLRLDGNITALYSITQYTMEESGDNIILTPTENTPEASYRVLYSLDISTEVPDLLSPVLSDINSLRGTSSWGKTAEWLDSSLNQLTYTMGSLV